ncbi:hypothetical protein [Streptomyces sp. NPDC002692]
MFAFGDEQVSAGGVAEVEEGLPGVHGEVGVRHPPAPGGPSGPDVAEVVLGGGDGPQGGALFALRGEGAGQASCSRERAAGRRARVGARVRMVAAVGWSWRQAAWSARSLRMPAPMSGSAAAWVLCRPATQYWLAAVWWPRSKRCQATVWARVAARVCRRKPTAGV